MIRGQGINNAVTRDESDGVEFFEFWMRDPQTGWMDHWIEVPAHDVRYGFNFPMIPE